MSNATELAERYIAIWNETDAGRRRALIAKTWTEDASYLDPMMRSNGHGGIDAMIAGVQGKYPGLKFSLAGKVDTHNDCLRFSWDLGPAGGAALAKGTDFAVVSDERLKAVTGFIDMMPGQA
jgi:hypothetical protein